MVRRRVAEKHGYRQIIVTEYTRMKLKELMKPLGALTYDEAIRELIRVYENLEREKARMLMCYELVGYEKPVEEWVKILKSKNLSDSGITEALRYLRGDARKLTVDLEMCREPEKVEEPVVEYKQVM